MNSILRRNPMAYCNWYTWYCNRHSILFQNNNEDDEIIIIVSSLFFLCLSLFSSMSCHPALPALVRGAEAKAKQNKTKYITKDWQIFDYFCEALRYFGGEYYVSTLDRTYLNSSICLCLKGLGCKISESVHFGRTPETETLGIDFLL